MAVREVQHAVHITGIAHALCPSGVMFSHLVCLLAFAGRLALLQDSEPPKQSVGKVEESCTHDKSSCGDGDAHGDGCCTVHCREQLVQHSLTVSLSVWLAMLTTAGLVAMLWL